MHQEVPGTSNAKSERQRGLFQGRGEHSMKKSVKQAHEEMMKMLRENNGLSSRSESVLEFNERFRELSDHKYNYGK